MELPHLDLNCTRRAVVLGAATALVAPSVLGHSVAGPVDPPLTPPPVELMLDDDAASSLASLLAGRVTALQLMFTVCQATCPIQGALFAAAAKQLGSLKDAQLVSLSIDPERDTPAALRAWMKRFGASPRWRAAQPRKQQLGALVDFLKSKNPAPDPHTAQAYYFDRKGRLVLRSVDFPPAPEVAKTLERLAAKK